MSDGTTEDASTEASSLKPSSSPARACAVVKVRLWLVRHGESEANAGGVIAGQQDSPLTDRGRNQARALGRDPRAWSLASNSRLLDGCVGKTAGSSSATPSWWRCYASDLSRAMETAQLILSELSNAESDGKDKNASASPVNASAELRIDRRLREKAYGAQELCRRGMTHEECVEVWRNRRASSSDSRASCNHDFPESGSTSFVPPLETEDDVWYRARSFLEEVLVDASQNGAKDEASASSVPNVLVVAHAGLVRQILKHVVGYERLQAHPRCAFVNDPGNIMSPVHQRFIIPNASLSVLELHARLPTSNSATVSTDFAFWDGPWPTPDVDLAASMTSNTASLLLLNYTDHERGGDD